MTGYRAGWLMGDERIIDGFKKLKTNMDSGTATFIQDAAGAALADEAHVDAFNADYKKKAEIISSALESIGLPNSMPKGTIYLWQKLKEGLGSLDFATKLLDPKIALVATPGVAISNEVDSVNPGEGYVRFALVPTMQEIKDAADRIRKLSL
jgi:LL-diaminopimelate aminotransferase